MGCVFSSLCCCIDNGRRVHCLTGFRLPYFSSTTEEEKGVLKLRNDKDREIKERKDAGSGAWENEIQKGDEDEEER